MNLNILALLVFTLIAMFGDASYAGQSHSNNPGTQPPTPKIIIEKNVMIPMRDGVRLATDIYRLDDAPPAPVLLARTPYNKDRPALKDWERFVRAGYVVAIQDVRGRYASEGDFAPHIQETDDGVDCFAWVAEQPWSNGKIGTYGGSYLGETQWLPARLNPPALVAMIPEVTFFDMYAECIYQGGAKVMHDLRWAAANIVEDSIERRRAAGESLPVEIPRPDVETVLSLLPLADHPTIREFASFYDEWLRHPTAGKYWEQMSPSSGYEGVTAPALNIGGWFDIFTWGTVQNYTQMKMRGGSETARKNQKLVIGPWSHINFTGKFPERDFGVDASDTAIDLIGIRQRWHDRWLKGEENGIDAEDPVLIFIMGIDKWRSEKDWPLPDTQYRNYYLRSSGRANTLHGNGVLSLEIPASDPADSYVYDPMNPVPTMGGQVLFPGENAIGPRDQREVEGREDVLVFTTPPLEKAVEVTGPIELRLFASSSAPDTDFTAKLVDVYPDGRAMILTDGILRARYRNSFETPTLLEPGKVYEFSVNMLATSNVFLPGHRIRLEVSSSNFPRYNRNSNSGGDISFEPAKAYRPATNRILHDAEHPSHLILPIIDR